MPLHLFGEEDSLEKKAKEIDDSRKLGSKIIFSIFNHPLLNKEIRQVLLSTEQEDIDSTNLNSNHLILQIRDHSSSIFFLRRGLRTSRPQRIGTRRGAGPSEEINKPVSSKFVCLNTPDNFVA